MTRTIKAQDVTPGMEIEYEHGGWTFRVVAGRCEESHGEVWVFSVAGVGRLLENGQEVTVLREAQPDEPTAFGAAVEAGGVWFVRLDVREIEDSDFQPWQSESLIQCTWGDICKQGPVTIINADPFASAERREPRKWDRWEDVPDRVTVRPTDVETPYRKVGDRIECKPVQEWKPSVTGEYDLNKYSPFTEVLPGA